MRISISFTTLIVIALTVPIRVCSGSPSCQATQGVESKLRDRKEFHLLSTKITEKMSFKEVEQILGPPDDISTSKDDNLVEGMTIWRYGTNGHKTMATLGTIMFGKNRKV
ncbi:MAG: hypothetical protein ABJA67_06620, partial [Chthonomonadales bacterium]